MKHYTRHGTLSAGDSHLVLGLRARTCFGEFDGSFQELFEVALGQHRHNPSRAVQLLVQRGQHVHGKLGLLLPALPLPCDRPVICHGVGGGGSLFRACLIRLLALVALLLVGLLSRVVAFWVWSGSLD